MEEYEQKINSGNVFLQSQAITKLYDTLLEKHKDKVMLYETEEVKALWKTANTGSATEAALAVEVLVTLVRFGRLPAPATLQNFLADVTNVKCPNVLLQGVTEVVLLLSSTGDSEEEGRDANLDGKEGKDGPITCPFTGPPKGPTHPFVTLLARRPNLAPALLEEAAHLLRHPNPRVREGSASQLRPLLLHTFCLTEETQWVARPLLSLLSSAQSHHGLVPLLCRIATLIRDTSRDHVERKVLVLSTLTTISVREGLTHLQSALLPCLLMVIPPALQHGLGTRTLERDLRLLGSRLGRGCDVTVCALAEVLPLTSGKLQVSLLQLGATLLSHKDGNPLVGARLLPSLLQVLSAPCTAIQGLTTAAAALTSLVQATPAQPSANTQLAGNEHWEVLSCLHPSLVSFLPALEFSDRLVKDPQLASDWLAKLASSEGQISIFYYTIVTSVFLYQGSTPQSVQQATKVLECEVMKQKSLALEVFAMVLYRLGREPDPTTRLTLLYTLPSLAVNKLCVGQVIKTLLALWSSGSLRPLVLRLMHDLWRVEPRTYSYLSRLLHDKTSDSTELQIARAFVVTSVCKYKPSMHGEELLPLLSSFLNECQGEEGTAQTLIAVDGIHHLCANQVIDLRTTWRAVAPKLVRDRRPGITEKLCALLGLIPVLKVESPEYAKFSSDCLTILWNWAASHRSLSVVKAAYQALEKFPYDDFTLKMLPQYAREGHQLPASKAATPCEAARKPEDVLDYVPCLAWTKLITGCPESHLECVESFVKSLVAKEVASLPKGLYLTAVQEAKRRGIKASVGQPEPPNYNFFKDNSILRALVTFLIECPGLMEGCNDPKRKERLLRSCVLSMAALGQSLPRPYPVLNWGFLEKVLSSAHAFTDYEWSKRLRHSVFQITGRQCNKSGSASSIITQWLTPNVGSGLTKEDEVVLFSLMDHLGRGVPPTVLQPFISHVFKQHRADSGHTKALLEALRPNLTADFIYDTNRNVLSNAVESLNDHMDPTDEELYTTYKACVADLPQKHIERLTSPSLWWEVTDEKLYRAAVLRCHVAERDAEDLALPWLNDLVDSASTLPGDRSHLLRVMSSTLITRCQVTEATTWFLQLLGRLQEHMKKRRGEGLVAAHEQRQLVTFYLDLLVMSLVVWSGLWATNSMEVLADNPPLRDRLLLPSLVTLSGQPEWKKTLMQLLSWLVSCYPLLSQQSFLHYHLAPPMLLLATLNPSLTQTMWNKVIALLV